MAAQTSSRRRRKTLYKPRTSTQGRSYAGEGATMAVVGYGSAFVTLAFVAAAGYGLYKLVKD